MSEDNTKNLGADSTDPLPFEEFVRQQLVALAAQMNGLREEMVERFLQLSRQIRELDSRVAKVEEEISKVRADIREDIRDLEDKVDPFIREHLKLKRDLRELLENRTA
ncbi:MAG: hypothetical protein ACREAM_19090 [Blastocatellia bacterium]